MKKIVGPLAVAILALVALSGCQTIFGRGHGPIASFAFLPQYNPGLSRPVQGRINESANPKVIEVVVPPGTDRSRLVATLSFDTEASISVISSGQNVLQKNSQTANNFQSPVLYSIKTSKDKKPWLYRIMVREADQNALLSRIEVVDGTPLAPGFNPKTQSYTTTVPYASTRVVVQAAAESPHLEKMTIAGHEARGSRAAVTVPFTGVDQLKIDIVAVAEDQTSTSRYTVTVLRGAPDRNSALSSLSVLNTTMRPAFSPSQLSYTVQVPYPTKALNVKAALQSKFATVALTSAGPRGGGTPPPAQGNLLAGNGARVDFTDSNRMDLVLTVTAQDGSTTRYTVTVVRTAPDRNNFLAQLQSPDATIRPGFNPNQLGYEVEVPYAASQFTVAALPQSSVASVAIAGAKYSGNPGSPDGAAVQFSGVSRAAMSIQVTAQDGSVRTYTLNVRRGRPDSNSHLATLLVTPGVLSPQFLPRVVSYHAVIPGGASAANVTVQTESPYATVSTSETGVSQSGDAANGKVFTVPVTAGQTRSVDFVVTAQDGSQRIYRVNVTREAAPTQPAPKDNNSRLSGIVVAGGALAPAFSAGRLIYTVDVPISQNRVSIFPIAESPKATVSVDGSAAGNSARAIELQPGKPRIVVIQVVAEDGSTTRYTVTMNREMPQPQKSSNENGRGGESAQSGRTGNGRGGESTTQQAPPQATGQQPPAAAQVIGVTVLLKSDRLRVDPKVWKSMRDAQDELGSQAVITIRYEGSNDVLLRTSAPVQIRQPGNSPPEITVDWQSPAFGAAADRQISIQIAIPTRRGWYLQYSGVMPVRERVSVTVPEWAYGSSPG